MYINIYVIRKNIIKTWQTGLYCIYHTNSYFIRRVVHNASVQQKCIRFMKPWTRYRKKGYHCMASIWLYTHIDHIDEYNWAQVLAIAYIIMRRNCPVYNQGVIIAFLRRSDRVLGEGLSFSSVLVHIITSKSSTCKACYPTFEITWHHRHLTMLLEINI